MTCSKQKNRERYKKWYEENKEKARADKAANMRKYRLENPEKYKKQSRASQQKLRDKIFETFGHCCAICGFSDKRALSLDHVFNNGAEERRLLSIRVIYRRSLLPENQHQYRMLCMNCQFVERHKANRQNQWRQQHGGF